VFIRSDTSVWDLLPPGHAADAAAEAPEGAVMLMAAVVVASAGHLPPSLSLSVR